jgi:hypothetical protein
MRMDEWMDGHGWMDGWMIEDSIATVDTMICACNLMRLLRLEL